MEFLENIEHNLSGIEFFSVGACPGCEDCGLDHIDHAEEDIHGFEYASEGDEFSARPCQSCGSHLAGHRIPAHGFIGGELAHLEVCHDCAMYHANGELPE